MGFGVVGFLDVDECDAVRGDSPGSSGFEMTSLVCEGVGRGAFVGRIISRAMGGGWCITNGRE